jgi:hypothetical protein
LEVGENPALPRNCERGPSNGSLGANLGRPVAEAGLNEP